MRQQEHGSSDAFLVEIDNNRQVNYRIKRNFTLELPTKVKRLQQGSGQKRQNTGCPCKSRDSPREGHGPEAGVLGEDLERDRIYLIPGPLRVVNLPIVSFHPVVTCFFFTLPNRPLSCIVFWAGVEKSRNRGLLSGGSGSKQGKQE